MLRELLFAGLVLFNGSNINTNVGNFSTRANNPSFDGTYLDVDSTRGIVKNGSNYSLSVKAYNNYQTYTFTSVDLLMTISSAPYYQVLDTISETKEFNQNRSYTAEFSFSGFSWSVGTTSPSLYLRFNTSSTSYNTNPESFSIVAPTTNLINDVNRYYFTYSDFSSYDFSYSAQNDEFEISSTRKYEPFSDISIVNDKLYITLPEWVSFSFGDLSYLQFKFSFNGSVSTSLYFDTEQNILVYNEQKINVSATDYDININRVSLNLSSVPYGINNATLDYTLNSGCYFYAYYGSMPDTDKPSSLPPIENLTPSVDYANLFTLSKTSDTLTQSSSNYIASITYSNSKVLDSSIVVKYSYMQSGFTDYVSAGTYNFDLSTSNTQNHSINVPQNLGTYVRISWSYSGHDYYKEVYFSSYGAVEPPEVNKTITFNFNIPTSISSSFSSIYFDTDLLTFSNEEDYFNTNLLEDNSISIPDTAIDNIFESQPVSFTFMGVLKSDLGSNDAFNDLLNLRVVFDSYNYSFNGQNRNDSSTDYNCSVVVDDIATFIDNAWRTTDNNLSVSIDLISMSKVALNTDIEVVDIGGLLFTILSLPFTFFTQAFDLTLFNGTPYAINIGDVFLLIISILIIIALIKLIMSLKG